MLVILMGVWAFAEAAWGPMVFSQRPQDPGAGMAQVAFTVGGTLAILGIFLVQRHRTLGRAAIIGAGLLHLAVPFAYRSVAPLPMIGTAVIGLILVIAAFFAGPLPRPVHIPLAQQRSGRP